MSNVKVYLKPLYTSQLLQLELQLRTLKNLLESISEDKPENKQEIISNPDPSCTECYLITEQPSEAFKNFWYFWIVYAIKGEQFNNITIRAFKKALTLEENSKALE
ncbi:9310_t:CDS:2, partial [Funneliformis mosseae]